MKKNYVGKAERKPLQEDERVCHAVRSQAPTSADFFVVLQNKPNPSLPVFSVKRNFVNLENKDLYWTKE